MEESVSDGWYPIGVHYCLQTGNHTEVVSQYEH